MTTFAELGLHPSLLRAVTAAGYETPTPIQSQAIPPALEGHDVLGIAQTGTGKTASFVLPMINALIQGRARARMPRSLVLAPTRELATQVAESFTTYSADSQLTMALLIGGTSFADQLTLVERGADVLIATPGRLLDHFERGKLLLSGVKIVTVDEADRMLDMGFIPDIERIFRLTPFTRQTFFFSATMAPEIERLTQEFLSNPVRVEVTRQATVGKNISQYALMLPPGPKDRIFKEKRALLRREIRQFGGEITNAIIFCNRKTDVDIVFKSLRKHRFDCAALHGDLDQSLRTKVLNDFRDGGKRFLVASDVAARGLDLPNVSHVFNFDVPINPEDYVHRIGRTGRAGRHGIAMTLVGKKEEKAFDAIEKLSNSEISRRTSQSDRHRSAKQHPQSLTDGHEGSRRRSRHDTSSSKKPRKRHKRTRRPPLPPVNTSEPIVGMGEHIPAFLKRD